MMLNLNNLDDQKKNPVSKIAGVIAGGVLMLVMVAALKRTDEIQATAGSNDIGMTEVLGQVLYRQYLLPFEISSILFLGAMVGAVYLSKKNNNSQDIKPQQ
jgi:NADH-quinone oxidoreductase subunit J